MLSLNAFYEVCTDRHTVRCTCTCTVHWRPQREVRVLEFAPLSPFTPPPLPLKQTHKHRKSSKSCNKTNIKKKKKMKQIKRKSYIILKFCSYMRLKWYFSNYVTYNIFSHFFPWTVFVDASLQNKKLFLRGKKAQKAKSCDITCSSSLLKGH